MGVAELSRIEKSVFIKAPRSRVWKALTSAPEFSRWFRVVAEGEFRPGARVKMTSTYPGHEGVEWFIEVEDVDPERKFSWRWHPGAQGSENEPTTLVLFELEDAPGGTLVKLTESGFDRISLAYRANAFKDNQQGWELQMQNITRYVEEAQ